MGSFVGIFITVAALLGGFAAMGGHLAVLMQPWEFVIIMGTAVGTFIVANPWKTVVDTGVACMQAITGAVPGERYYLDLLGALHALMRELRGKGRNEVEAHIDDPASSEIFKAFPSVLGDPPLLQFICDYVRLIIMGNARTHEIEALMDEEIHTIVKAKLAPYNSIVVVSEALLAARHRRRRARRHQGHGRARPVAEAPWRLHRCGARRHLRLRSSCPTVSFRPLRSRSK